MNLANWNPNTRAKVDPIDGGDFREVFFKEAGGQALRDLLSTVREADPDGLARWFWGASDGDIIDRFHMATNDNVAQRTAAQRIAA